MTFLRAKIVGQYEPHDPLESRAMVSITTSCTTTPRRTFSRGGSMRLSRVASRRRRKRYRHSSLLPYRSRASDANFYHLDRARCLWKREKSISACADSRALFRFKATSDYPTSAAESSKYIKKFIFFFFCNRLRRGEVGPARG